MLKGWLIVALLVTCLARAHGDRKRDQSDEEASLLALGKTKKALNPAAPSNSIEAFHAIDAAGYKKKSQADQIPLKADEKKAMKSSNAAKSTVHVDTKKSQPLHSSSVAVTDKKNSQQERKNVYGMSMGNHWSKPNGGFNGQNQMDQSGYSSNNNGASNNNNVVFNNKNNGAYNRNGAFNNNNNGAYNRNGAFNNNGAGAFNNNGAFNNKNNGAYNRNGGFSNNYGAVKNDGALNSNNNGAYNRNGAFNNNGASNRNGAFSNNKNQAFNKNNGAYNNNGAFNKNYNNGGGGERKWHNMKSEGKMSQTSHVSNKMGGRPSGSFRLQNEGKYSQSGKISNSMGGKSWSHSSTYKVQNNGGYNQPGQVNRKMGSETHWSKSGSNGEVHKSGYSYDLTTDQKGSTHGVIKVLGNQGGSKYNHGLMGGRHGVISNGVLKVGLLNDRKKKKSNEETNEKEEPQMDKTDEKIEDVEEEEAPSTDADTEEITDVKREQSDEPESGTVKVDVVVEAEDTRLDNDTDDIDDSSENETVAVSSAASKHAPRHHVVSTKRGDVWYLQPHSYTHSWGRGARAHNRRNFPSTFKNSGRWWYYKSSVKRNSHKHYH